MEQRLGSTKTYRILLADDHAIVRRGLRDLLESHTEFVICGEASSGQEAIDLAMRLLPDLAILDLTMPALNGLAATRIIRSECPNTQVLILTMHASEEFARLAMLAGSLGYVLKSDADKNLLDAVDHVRRHCSFFTSSLSLSPAQSSRREQGNSLRNDTASITVNRPEPSLTHRLVEVLQLLALGKANKEVAAMLGISIRTVESHRAHLMRILNCSSFSELVRYAVRENLIDP